MSAVVRYICRCSLVEVGYCPVDSLYLALGQDHGVVVVLSWCHVGHRSKAMVEGVLLDSVFAISIVEALVLVCLLGT